MALDVSGLAAAKKPRDAVASANVARFSHVLVRAVQFIETMSNESVVLDGIS